MDLDAIETKLTAAREAVLDSLFAVPEFATWANTVADVMLNE